MAEQAMAATGQNVAVEFETYEDYLDSQVTATDLYYLEDRELARQLVELGYRGSGEPLRRDEFDARKKAADAARSTSRWRNNELLSAGKDLSRSPFLMSVAAREEPNRNGSMASIMFLRTTNARGHEVSGYIDLAHRLKADAAELYFGGTRRLLPRTSDLSYYNWETQQCVTNNSPNWQVLAEGGGSSGSVDGALQFRNKRDRKILQPDLCLPTSEDTVRCELQSLEYSQIVFYDHQTRRKT